jgi:hypothetical protein
VQPSPGLRRKPTGFHVVTIKVSGWLGGHGAMCKMRDGDTVNGDRLADQAKPCGVRRPTTPKLLVPLQIPCRPLHNYDIARSSGGTNSCHPTDAPFPSSARPQSHQIYSPFLTRSCTRKDHPLVRRNGQSRLRIGFNRVGKYVVMDAEV